MTGREGGEYKFLSEAGFRRAHTVDTWAIALEGLILVSYCQLDQLYQIVASEIEATP